MQDIALEQLQVISCRAINDDFSDGEVWKMKCKPQQDNKKKPPQPARKWRIPMMVFIPSFFCGDNECESGTKKKSRRTQSVKELMEYEEGRLLRLGIKERAEDIDRKSTRLNSSH